MPLSSIFEKLPPLDLRAVLDRATLIELDLGKHESIAHLEDLPHFAQLQTLRLGMHHVLTDLAPIAALHQLTRFSIDNQRHIPSVVRPTDCNL